jgi:lipoprotein-releasing system ATP-binding protein
MISGIPAKRAENEAARLLSGMGLGERLTHRPSQLSGGEQQRVAIARALANKPRILLGDEPTGNLDPATSDSVFRSLYELTRREGVAALIATHNMSLVPFFDRVLTVQDGLVVPYIGSATVQTFG